MTCCFSVPDMDCARSRAMASLGPPAAKGTIMVMVRVDNPERRLRRARAQARPWRQAFDKAFHRVLSLVVGCR
jgi:ribosomal protein L15E